MGLCSGIAAFILVESYSPMDGPLLDERSAGVIGSEVEHPWAVTLQRGADAWRVHQEAQERIREEKAEALKEKRKQEEANRVQRPSAGRNRSDRDKAERARFVESRKRENAVHAVDEYNGVAARNGGFNPPSAMRPAFPPVPPYRPQPDDDPPYLDQETLALTRKITTAGYRTREDGRVLYNNTEWITPQDWRKGMGPGIID